MRVFRILFLSAACFLAAPCLADLVEDQAEERVAADALFQQSSFAQAKAEYLELAKEGDKFAQFRLALIYYFALDGEKDLLQAGLWAGIAQEPELLPLRQLFVLIAQEMNLEQQQELKQLIAQLDPKYGVTVMAKQERVFERSRSCTGSRVGNNCDRVNSFGTLREGLGNYQDNALVGHIWRPDDISAFNTRYSAQILEEFGRFDALAQQSAAVQ